MALLPVEDALSQMLAKTYETGKTSVPLAEALNRVTAQDISANLTQPPFDSSAMDGFAVQAADTTLAPNSGTANALKIIGTSAAGVPFDGTLHQGETVRIFTGAPVPTGANAVLMQEDAKFDADVMEPTFEVFPGRHIRPKGNDFTKGQMLIAKSQRINSHDIALLAAANCAKIPVSHPPTITLVSTGDELVPLGTEPGAGQIISSNTLGLGALLTTHGAACTDHGVIPDNLETTIDNFRQILTGEIDAAPDILVTIGGASVGDHDYVQDALIAAGAKIDFWKIALRPGKPLMFGTYGNTLILGLPGNPVSALTCAHIFLLPIIRKSLGVPPQTPTTTAKLIGELPTNGPRQFYMRAHFARTQDGTLAATPVHTQDSSHLRSLAAANGFVIIAPNAPALRNGDAVTAMLFE